MLSIIGGTGFYQMEGLEIKDILEIAVLTHEYL
jgi:hypothetical protein